MAIRKSSKENEVEVEELKSTGRPSWEDTAEYRIIQKYKDRIRNPGTAIRAHCIQCYGGMIAEVSRCPAESCPLWLFRMGKNVFHSRSVKARERKEAEDALDN